MRERDALLISALITLVLVGNFVFFHDFGSNIERVVVKKVIDGDTVKLEDGRTVRLVNINTPEKGDFYHDQAEEFLKEIEGETIGLEKLGLGKYGRTLGRIFSDKYLNLEIIKNGFAHSYIVEDNELKEFKEAEKEAFKNQIGIWQRSQFYGCLKVEINKYEEYVIIESLCNLSFYDWTVKDESTKKYTIGRTNSKEIKIYSSSGKSSEDEFYWGKGNIWNNDKDSIFIRDDKGFLVYYDSYGY